ncbi:MAG: transporter substrate-binding domain-containing protein [Fibrobacter sp.]|nr:transporter substrate-binding domain-containing protein [Fibrobacter sp.]
MRTKKWMKQITVFLLTVILVSMVTAPCYATESNRKTVRVAYFSIGEYYQTDSDGTLLSYDVDYLNQISKCSDFDFEYIDCGTWENALHMLENHQVDLVGTAQWTEEREQQYEYCLESYGYTVSELVANKDSNIRYEDYTALSQCTIGCTEKYVRKSDLVEWMTEHDVKTELKLYPDEASLEEALRDNKVDLAALNSHSCPTNTKQVERLKTSPYFFISWKGNTELTNAIDEAIMHINLESPEFDDNLIQTYFYDILGVPLSLEEENLIAEGKTYTIYFDGVRKAVRFRTALLSF